MNKYQVMESDRLPSGRFLQESTWSLLELGAILSSRYVFSSRQVTSRWVRYRLLITIPRFHGLGSHEGAVRKQRYQDDHNDVAGVLSSRKCYWKRILQTLRYWHYTPRTFSWHTTKAALPRRWRLKRTWIKGNLQITSVINHSVSTTPSFHQNHIVEKNGNTYM